MCPGTDVYMPPEAVKNKPVYTEKIDCFSFGVIVIQTITQQFPKPEDRRKEIQINQPGLPPIVEVPVSEIERRQNHIGEIDPNHTLLQVALDCLKDRDIERPSAQQLCERVAALKEDPQYSESVRVVEARSTAEQDRSDERDRELRSLRQQHSQQIQGLQQIIQSQTSRLAENDQAITQNEEIITKLRRQVQQFERQLGHVNQQLEESERVNAQFQKQIAELEQLRPATDISSSSKEQRTSINLTWREGGKAPCKMSGSHRAAVDGSTLYVVLVDCQTFCYTVSTSSWSRLPNTPTSSCPLVIINNLLTLVGGICDAIAITNQLFSLTGQGSGRRWTEEFPPMPTKRYGMSVLCIEIAVIVAGGGNTKSSGILGLHTVELLNTETLQWSTAADLPQPLSYTPAAVCGDQVYILGKSNMYTCSVITLIQSCKSFLASFRNKGARVWKEVAAPPVTESTSVSIHGRLLAIGGEDSDQKPTSAIHMYNPPTDSWEVISHMGTPRTNCIAAVLPSNQLMVVGGFTIRGIMMTIDTVELASVE
jgi:hypothetical protein